MCWPQIKTPTVSLRLNPAAFTSIYPFSFSYTKIIQVSLLRTQEKCCNGHLNWNMIAFHHYRTWFLCLRTVLSYVHHFLSMPKAIERKLSQPLDWNLLGHTNTDTSPATMNQNKRAKDDRGGAVISCWQESSGKFRQSQFPIYCQWSSSGCTLPLQIRVYVLLCLNVLDMMWTVIAY